MTKKSIYSWHYIQLKCLYQCWSYSQSPLACLLHSAGWDESRCISSATSVRPTTLRLCYTLPFMLLCCPRLTRGQSGFLAIMTRCSFLIENQSTAFSCSHPLNSPWQTSIAAVVLNMTLLYSSSPMLLLWAQSFQIHQLHHSSALAGSSTATTTTIWTPRGIYGCCSGETRLNLSSHISWFTKLYLLKLLVSPD